MKGIVPLVIFALFRITTSENYKECDGVELGENIPFPGNCTKYITCIGGGESRICRRPLHFNAKKQVCDLPERANCTAKSDGNNDKDKEQSGRGDSVNKDKEYSGVTGNDKKADGELGSQCKNITLGKNIPHPRNCSKFITCIGGGVVKNCPDKLEFNAVKQVCDWPERANCSSKSDGNNDNDKHHSAGGDTGNKDKDNSGVSGNDKKSDGDLGSQCKNVRLGKNIPHPGNCSKFITCIGGGVVKNCPDKLEFNAVKQVCDWPERANCSSKSDGNNDNDKHHSAGGDTGNKDKDNSGVSGNDKKSDGDLGSQCKNVRLGKNIPHPGNCSKFITCIGGGVVKNCPDKLEFNAVKQVCDWPERANCSSKSDGNNDNDKHHSAGGDTGNKDKDNSGVSGNDKKSDGDLGSQCKNVRLGKNIPHPGNCSKFITCIGGGVVKNCPDKLEFNAVKQVCDWPERANCSSKSDGNNDNDKHHSAGGDTGNKDKDNSGVSGNDKKADGELGSQCKNITLGKNIPHPRNCSKFITCIGGGVVKNCPDKLEFNAVKQVCDWPERANCSSKSDGNNDKDKDHYGGSDTGNQDKDNLGGIDNDKNAAGKLRPECQDVTVGKIVAYPGNHSKYIICIGGGEVQNCPENSEFNAVKQVCDWPDRAQIP